MSESSLVEALVRRDRLVMALALALMTLLAWAYLLSGAGMNMDMSMGDMAMPMVMAWTPGYALVVFLMWWIMMIAMMLPSAAPMILIFGTVNRKTAAAGKPYVPTAIFLAGYLLVWAAFSLAATLAQYLLESAGLMSPAMATTHRVTGGVLLLAAGIYQMTPLKHACLRHCRGPISFITQHWRPGHRGALRMGIVHGAFCVGCCWVVMGLLFYGGVMNLAWIVGLTLLVLLEKLVPPGHWIGSLSGVVFLAWGAWLLLAGGAPA